MFGFGTGAVAVRRVFICSTSADGKYYPYCVAILHTTGYGRL